MDTLIRNATIATHDSVFQGSIGIENGKIHSIHGPDCQATASRVIDAGQNLLIPGVIDSHVHFQDPGYTHREDLEHGTMAAAVGGVTTAISHPLNLPPIVDKESYRQTIEMYAERSYIDYGIHGGGTSDNGDRIEALWNETGATTIKMFMCFSVSDFPFVRDDALYNVLSILARIGGVAMLHAENNEINALMERQLLAQNRIDPMAHIASHPPQSELEAVRRALYFLEITGAEAVILHTGMAECIDEIRAAKQRGVKVHIECCPHVLTFRDQDMMEKGPYLKFTPVMRDEANRKELWKRLEAGHFDTIGSDHSPYTAEEKEAGAENIWKAPNGIPGIQTLLPVLLDGVSRGALSLPRLVEVTSWNPARIYGLSDRKGAIRPGMDADFVLCNLDKVHTFTEEDIKSKAKWSPYTGMTFHGWPVLTMVRGEIVAKDGVVKGKKGYGIYQPRRKGAAVTAK